METQARPVEKKIWVNPPETRPVRSTFEPLARVAWMEYLMPGPLRTFSGSEVNTSPLAPGAVPVLASLALAPAR
ncbi:Uncharacterised protein [Mycobacteroides abscessus subsp. abscessus]|nr:Uncharacterised protein [Mycobacteroides abscessus subsp. abscessus]